MNPTDLATLVDKQLRRLPQPRAPHTLLPRALAAVQAWSERPWYGRAWFTWPLGWQMASMALLLVVVGSSVFWLPRVNHIAADGVSALVSALPVEVTDLTLRVRSTVQPLAVATTAARILWRTVLSPLVASLAVLIVLMCGACAAFGSALNHILLGRAFQR